MSSPTWISILEEYSDKRAGRGGSIASDRMTEFAFSILDKVYKGYSKEETVLELRKEATRLGVLHTIHKREKSEPGLIPTGATNEQIIVMIEQG